MWLKQPSYLFTAIFLPTHFFAPTFIPSIFLPPHFFAYCSNAA